MSDMSMNWRSRHKVRAPQYQVELIKRERLFRAIAGHADKPLILITAPAGFGKTCLVCQWLQSALAPALHGWVNLDAEDSDPRQFLSYLLLALQQTKGLLGELEALIGHGFVEAPPKLVIAALAERLAEQGPGAIILDGYQHAQNEALNAIVSELVEALPEQWQLIIVGRVRPGIPVSSLRLHGLVAEFSDRDLSFDRDEVIAFFDGAIAADLVAELLQKTAGWPAALQMLKLYLQGSGGASDLSHFPVNHELVADYLAEQVLSEMELQEYDFLLETAFLDDVPVALADYIRNRNDSRYLAERLLRLRPLVASRGSGELTLLYQPVFRDFLFQELKTRRSADTLGKLRMRAAHWYRENGDLLAAVKQLCAIGEYDLAESYIKETGGWATLTVIGEATLANILRLFPENHSVFTRVCRIPLLIKSGRLNEARQELEQVKPLCRDWGDDDLMTLEISLDGYQDRQYSKATLAYLTEKSARPPGISTEVFSVVLTTEILHYLHMGDIKRAAKCIDKALTEIKENDAPYARIYFYYYQGLCEWYSARWQQAEQYYRLGLELAERGFGALSGVACAGKALLAQLLYYTGRQEQCREILHPALELISDRDGWHDPYCSGYDAAVRLCYDTQGLETALQCLERGMAVANERHLKRMELHLLLLRSELLLLEGDALSALEFLTTTVNPLLPENWWQSEFWWQLRPQYANIRLQCLWRMDHGSAFARYLNQWEASLKAPLLHYLGDVWRAAYEFSKGNAQAARERILPVLQWVDSEQSHTWFQTIGAPIKLLLEYLQESLPEYRQLLERCSGPECANASLNTLLSDREYQVLVMLQQGLSNKLIARHMEATENTVKFHLKNIYRKLGVGKRLAAVEAARKMGLIPTYPK